MQIIGVALMQRLQQQKIVVQRSVDLAALADLGDLAFDLRQAFAHFGFLDAIEKNQFDKLPGGIFTRGFIRSYASLVGLDPGRYNVAVTSSGFQTVRRTRIVAWSACMVITTS